MVFALRIIILFANGYTWLFIRAIPSAHTSVLWCGIHFLPNWCNTLLFVFWEIPNHFPPSPLCLFYRSRQLCQMEWTAEWPNGLDWAELNFKIMLEWIQCNSWKSAGILEFHFTSFNKEDSTKPPTGLSHTFQNENVIYVHWRAIALNDSIHQMSKQALPVIDVPPLFGRVP